MPFVCGDFLNNILIFIFLVLTSQRSVHIASALPLKEALLPTRTASMREFLVISFTTRTCWRITHHIPLSHVASS